jgi:hypothetical protein
MKRERFSRVNERFLKAVLACAGLLALPLWAMGEGKPIQVSLTPDIAAVSRHERIEGVTLGVWSENPQTALALGLVNGSSIESAGASLGLALNYADSYRGVHFAPVNYSMVDFLGWQAGFVNYTAGFMKGLQSGVVNYAGSLTGLQFGLVNFAGTANAGFQIGLVNIIHENKAWFDQMPDQVAPGMLFVNWRF